MIMFNTGPCWVYWRAMQGPLKDQANTTTHIISQCSDEYRMPGPIIKPQVALCWPPSLVRVYEHQQLHPWLQVYSP